MERQPQTRADGPADPGFRASPGWAVVLLGLIVWQGWMALGLFGPDRPWARLFDDQPIVSGRHALHLYHGYLGAWSLIHSGTPCCYDPAFQAGYPKTPIFDSGSRPAKVFLGLTGGTYSPAAYKLGLAGCCLLVPLFLAIAAQGAGLGCGAACLAAALGSLVWWGRPCRTVLEAGDLDLLVAALAGLAHVGLLIRFDRAPSFTTWLGLCLIDALGWFTHPLFFAGTVPLNLLYYLSVGARHRRLGWHFALLAALVGGMGLNAGWLMAWVMNWWIASPLPVGLPILSHCTFRTVWTASLWGAGGDRALALAIFGTAAVGLGWFQQCKNRAAARLLGVATVGLLAVAIAGLACEPLGRRGFPRLLVPALWFAVLPATHALLRGARLLGRRLAGTSLEHCGVALQRGWAPVAVRADAVALAVRAGALTIGLGPQRQALVEALQAHTTSEARVLWEEQPNAGAGCCWTALLPLLTQRVFLGGLDPRPISITPGPA